MSEVSRSFLSFVTKQIVLDRQYKKQDICYVMEELHGPYQLPSASTLVYLYIITCCSLSFLGEGIEDLVQYNIKDSSL